MLVDVLGFSTAEAADLLDVGTTAVKGLLQRARNAIDAGPGVHPRPSADAERVIAERFARAYSNDVDGVLALLTDQAWLAMPPAPHLYREATRSARSSRRASPGVATPTRSR